MEPDVLWPSVKAVSTAVARHVLLVAAALPMMLFGLLGPVLLVALYVGSIRWFIARDVWYRERGRALAGKLRHDPARLERLRALTRAEPPARPWSSSPLRVSVAYACAVAPGLLRAGHAEEALELLRSTEKPRGRRTAVHAALVATACLKLDRLDEATDALASAMRSPKPGWLVPRLQSLEALLELRRGRARRALQLAEAIDGETPARVRHARLAVRVHALCALDDQEGALRLLREDPEVVDEVLAIDGPGRRLARRVRTRLDAYR